jgi:hypothetical protein
VDWRSKLTAIGHSLTKSMLLFPVPRLEAIPHAVIVDHTTADSLPMKIPALSGDFFITRGVNKQLAKNNNKIYGVCSF